LDGHKKLSDFFIDRKVPRAERPSVPLLVAGDTIAWIVGHAVGEPYRATGGAPTVLCCTAEKRAS
jgi:tRNA(Ile)-lysidine synthase